MKIILVCTSMQNLSGSPLYHYTLAKELAKEYQVAVLSRWTNNHLLYDLEDLGVEILTEPKGHYDLAIVSQNDMPLPSADKIVNVIHSEYDCEAPRDNMEHYVAIRPSIKEHLIKEHNIPEEKIEVIYNGVDLEKFSPIEKSERDYFKVVIPATRDSLRQKMFDYYVNKANKDYRVFIFGTNFGARIQGEYIYQFDEVSNIEEHIGDADLVAGILLGRVNLEARAMNVKSVIHNPDNPEDCYEYYPDRQEFEKMHDIKNITKKFYDTYINTNN
jgi:glycosyltransferase involved in cell wall biosynthesis